MEEVPKETEVLSRIKIKSQNDMISEYVIFFKMDVEILIYWLREQQDDLESQNELWDISRQLSSHLALEVPFFSSRNVDRFFVSLQEATHST